MDFAFVILAAAATFGLCWLLDKGFTKKFRGTPQHQSGLSVRLNRHYGGGGLVVAVLGVAGVLTGLGDSWLLMAGGGLLILTGAALVVYYMTFGVYYDEETFLHCSFGKGGKVYHYRDIRCQQLFNGSGNIIIELYMNDGSAVQLHGAMDGVYPFLDHAFSAWCRQKGIRPESCAFHKPEESCWFPKSEG